MKATLALVFTIVAVVVSFPTETPDNAGIGMNDLLASIGRIQERVKGMRGIASGNHTGIEQEMMEGINKLSKNVTYEDLIDRVQLASQKIKELQQLLGSSLKNLDKKYPRPSDSTTEKPAAAE